MAQFDYFGTWNDSWAVLGEVFSRGDVKVYWDAGPHDQPAASSFPALTEELKTRLRHRHRVFLFGSFSTHPPAFWQQHEGIHDGKFFLSQTGGGPSIAFSLARELGDRLIAGSLVTQPAYELTEGRFEKPGPALKAAYQDLVKRMKKHLTRYQGEWIGPEALRLLQSGQVQLPAGVGRSKPAPSSSSSPPMAPLPRAAGPSR